MIIREARIVLKDRIFDGDLQYENGKITKLGKGLTGDKAISASGHYIIPGAIDAHVHFRDPEATAKEDFFTGSCAAIAGGVTTVIDMPCYRKPATTTLAALKQKMKIAKDKFVCDYAFNFGANGKNFAEVKKSVKNFAGLKMFLSETNSELTIGKSEIIEKHFDNLANKKPLIVHCEDEEAIPEGTETMTDAVERAKARGSGAALVGLSKACVLARGRRMHVAHITTAEEVDLAKSFANVTCEVTPHHLLLSTKDLELLGAYGKTNPPLRTEAQRLALWQRMDKIDMIASDHAPHTRAEKMSGEPPSGMPGVETMVHLMLTACNEGRISLVQLCRMMSTRPAEVFGLKRKGEIAVGKDADFLIVDMKEQWRLHEGDLHSKCGWTPFKDYGMRGKIRSVILRGKEACYDGRILAKRGSGKPAL